MSGEAVSTKRGRPPKFREDYSDMALHLCRLGATNKDLAKAFGVSVAGVDKWLATKPGFAAQVAEGREMADARVATALFQRAVGSVVPDSHVAVIDGKVVVTPMEKHFPPDVGACSLWLRNRKPSLWREKTSQSIEVTATGDNPYHELATRLMEADDERFQRIYADELERMQAGNPTVISADEPKRMDSPLHSIADLPAPHTDAGARSMAQMMIEADRDLGFRGGPALEAEIIPSGPALPPESHAERVSEPEARAMPSEDFRALLGLPPEEI